MSTVFRIATASAPPPSEVLEGLSDEGLVVEPEHADRPEVAYHVFRRPRSVRGVTAALVTDEGESHVEVRLQVFASHEDWAIGLHLVKQIATRAQAPITGDLGEFVDADALAAAGVTPDLWRTFATSGVRAISHLIDQGRGPITLGGPLRQVYVGERVRGELTGADPDATVDRWMAFLRDVQYFGDGDDNIGSASVFAVGDELGPDVQRRFAVWYPVPTWVMPRVDFVMIHGEAAEDVVAIPPDAVEALAPRWRWLDECQRVVTGFSEAEWPDLRERARAFAIDPRG